MPYICQVSSAAQSSSVSVDSTTDSCKAKRVTLNNKTASDSVVFRLVLSCKPELQIIRLVTNRGCLNPVTNAGRTSVDIGASAKLELVDKFCYLGDMLNVFIALTLLVGRQEGHPACKKLSGEVLAWLSVWSEMQTCIWPS